MSSVPYHAREARRVTRNAKPILGTDLVVHSGTGKMGAGKFGAPGGAAQSVHNVLAAPWAEEIALLMGIDAEVAAKFLRAAGLVAQRRLLQGLACGVPYVGVLAIRDVHIGQKRLAYTEAYLRDDIERLRQAKAVGYKGTQKASVDQMIAAKETTLANLRVVVRNAYLHMTTCMADLFRSNAAYVAPVKAQARTEWMKTGRRKWDSTYHLTKTERAALIAAGATFRASTSIPVPKVRTHVRQLDRQFAAQRRAEAARRPAG